MKWPNWMRFSLRSLLLGALLVGSVLALNHNWESWYLERKLIGHGAEVRTAMFSMDGRSVVTASDDNTSRVWDVQTGKGDILYGGSAGLFNSAIFSPDSRLAVLIGYSRDSLVLDVEKRAVLAIINREVLRARYAAFSPDGRDLLVGSNKKILAFEVQNGFKEPRLKFEDLDRELYSANYSPDGKTFAVLCYESLRLFDSQTGKSKGSLMGFDFSDSVVFAADGKSILFINYNGLNRWDLKSYTVTNQYKIDRDIWAPVERAVECSPIGNHLLTSGAHVVRIRTLEGKTLYVLPHQFGVNSAKYSSDGERIVTASDDCIARIWRRTRPEEWWGIAWRPELWLSLIFLILFIWSLRRDWRGERTALKISRSLSL